MKCEANRKALLDAFTLASSVTQAKSQKPILRHVLMDADPDRGTFLMATNLEIGVRVPVVGCVVDEPGVAMLDGERVGSALASYPDDQVRITSEGSILSIVGSRSKSSLTSDDAALFPIAPSFPGGGPSWTISHVDLGLLADRTVFATDAKSSATYAFGGCFLEFGPESLSMVATDGRRLSIMTVPADGGLSDIKAVVTPAALKLADRLFEGDAAIRVAFSGQNPLSPSMIHLKGDSGEIAARLIEGRFPAYRSFMLDDFRSKARTTAGAFRSAVKCASIVTGEESRGVDMAFTAESMGSPAMVAISANVADRGSSESSLEIEYEGPPVTVCLASQYLLESLAKLDADLPLTIRLKDADTMVELSLADGWIHTLMTLSR